MTIKVITLRLCTTLPWTTSRPSAVRLILVPGLLAAHTYTPECCRETSEIIRFPVPRTWIPSTPMERPSEGEHQNINQVILHQTSPSPQVRWRWWRRLVVVVPTEPAPGHYGPWVPSGDALQNGCLVNIDGEVLRSWQDDWLLVDPGGCACSRDHNRDELWCLLHWAKKDKPPATLLSSFVLTVTVSWRVIKLQWWVFRASKPFSTGTNMVGNIDFPINTITKLFSTGCSCHITELRLAWSLLSLEALAKIPQSTIGG